MTLWDVSGCGQWVGLFWLFIIIMDWFKYIYLCVCVYVYVSGIEIINVHIWAIRGKEERGDDH